MAISLKLFWCLSIYRLNGTARRDSIANCLPEGLPFPSSTREACQGTIQSLRMEVDALEKKLQESSKVSSLCRLVCCFLMCRECFSVVHVGLTCNTQALCSGQSQPACVLAVSAQATLLSSTEALRRLHATHCLWISKACSGLCG